MVSKEIKLLMSLAVGICLLPTMQGQETSKGGVVLPPDRFDQWGDITFDDERVHLDKIANQANEWPLSIVYVVIHAGQTACVGEAKARGIRAKNYLVARGVSPGRVVSIDAGWQKTLEVEVWIWPPEFAKPRPATTSNLKAGAVTLQRACRIKYRGGN